MTRRPIIGVFDREEDLLHATAAARHEGLDIVDVFSPHVVHGLDRAMGLRPSRLPWVCFVLGLFGALAILLFQFWTSAVSWPINVGGKPWNSLPAFVPATFEMMVLCGGVGTVAAFIWVAGLRPGSRSALSDLRVTDDRFALVIGETGNAFDRAGVTALLSRCHAVAIEERTLGGLVEPASGGSTSTRPTMSWGTIALGVALAASIGLNVLARMPKTRPNVEYAPDMVRTARYNTFEANPNFPDGMTLRAPVSGTIPRGLGPPADGNDVNPFSADDQTALARGAVVFANFCQPCHGANGQGDGLVVMHGFPTIRPLYRGQTLRMRDVQMFRILTSGGGAMPPYGLQLSREDRWKAILHVRTLRAPAPPAEGGGGR